MKSITACGCEADLEFAKPLADRVIHLGAEPITASVHCEAHRQRRPASGLNSQCALNPVHSRREWRRREAFPAKVTGCAESACDTSSRQRPKRPGCRRQRMARRKPLPGYGLTAIVVDTRRPVGSLLLGTLFTVATKGTCGLGATRSGILTFNCQTPIRVGAMPL